MNRAGSWWHSAHWHLAPMDTPILDRVKLYEGPQLVADSGVIIDEDPLKEEMATHSSILA